MKSKAKFGYFKMDDTKKAMFDKMQKGRQGNRVATASMMKTKMAAMKKADGFDKMTDEQKDAWTDRALSFMKNLVSRQE